MNQFMVNLFFARSEGLRKEAQAIRMTVDQGLTLVFQQMATWLNHHADTIFPVFTGDTEIEVSPGLVSDEFKRGRALACALDLGHAFDELIHKGGAGRREFFQIFRIARKAHFRAIRGIRREASDLGHTAKHFRKKLPAELRPQSAFAA